MTAFTQKQIIKIKESKFQIQNQTFRTIKSIKEKKEKNERKRKNYFYQNTTISNVAPTFSSRDITTVSN